MPCHIVTVYQLHLTLCMLLQQEPFEVYKERFEAAMSVDELNEWFSYFRLLSGPPGVEQMAPKAVKKGEKAKKSFSRPRRASRYHSLVSAGLHSLASKLVMDTETFSKSIDTISPDAPTGFVEPLEEDAQLPDPENEADIYYSARNDTLAQATPDQIERMLSQAVFILVQVSSGFLSPTYVEAVLCCSSSLHRAWQ